MKHWIIRILAIASLSALTYRTYQQNKVWADDITLWKNAVEASPGSCKAHSAYSIELMKKYGGSQEALDHALTGLQIAERLPASIRPTVCYRAVVAAHFYLGQYELAQAAVDKYHRWTREASAQVGAGRAFDPLMPAIEIELAKKIGK